MHEDVTRITIAATLDERGRVLATVTIVWPHLSRPEILDRLHAIQAQQLTLTESSVPAWVKELRLPLFYWPRATLMLETQGGSPTITLLAPQFGITTDIPSSHADLLHRSIVDAHCVALIMGYEEFGLFSVVVATEQPLSYS